MPLSVFATLLVACAVIALTPGAGAVNSMSTSLRAGWAKTGWTVLGQELALAVQLLITALGLGFVIVQHPEVLMAVKVAGALYLVYLGVRLLLEKPHATEAPASSHARATPAALVRRGFIVNITNPKAILFFLAFIPQFVNPNANLPVQYAIIMATLVGLDVIVMWGFYGGAAKALNRFTGSPQGQLTLNRIFGVLFLLIAGLVAFMPLH